ncbi:hypothetical protein [Flexithrix dorotheae]|uniref:hypothetical protein n=1 Tax=Flexithrix dorotheae TaxID=70993 RepID=UPI0003658302|nr:hypothetical protein [Flexithrix dorotheae]
MQTVFTSEYLIIKTDHEASILYWEWTEETKHLTDDKFLALAKIIMDKAYELKYQNAIDNALNFRFAVSVQLQEKMAATMFSIRRYFTSRLAHVNAKEMVSSLSQQQVWEENKEKKYVEKYFNNLEDAMEWIRNNNL